MLCSEIQLVKSDYGGEDVLPLACNRWSCPYCGPKRRRRLMAMAANGLPTRMLTLTVSPAVGSSPLERRQLLHDAWKKLTKRIMRKEGWKQLHYMAFVEKTKRGEPHLHILLRCGYISQKWISAQMRDLVGAPFVWISLIRNAEHAVRYVAKYVTKEPAQFGSLKRYWRSRWYTQEVSSTHEKQPFDRWTTDVVRASYSETSQNRIRQGWTVETLENGWLRWWRPGRMPWADIAARASLRPG